MYRTPRRGFSIVELLAVMVIISALATIGIPRYRYAKERALAAAIVADMQQIRAISYQVFATINAWPEDMPPGVVPPSFVQSMGPGASFSRVGYTLDWDVVNVPVAGQMVQYAALTVRPESESLVPIIRGQLGAPAAQLTTSDAVVFLIDPIIASSGT
jgi:prepilin-type N-terminal cleavage/methylation domain-containing protein